ncbi:AAA family ATPase [Patescibacteria group bacterium]
MPKLVIVGGSLATGKSTISNEIAKQTGWQRVSMDEIKETLFDVGGYRDREWSQGIGRLAFPVFQELIGMHLSRGEHVIADATFLWPSDVEWLHDHADKHEAELVQIWMSADPRVARERFVARANKERHPGHNDALEHVLDEFDQRFFSKSFVPLPIRGETMIVDTTYSTNIDLNKIINFLSS